MSTFFEQTPILILTIFILVLTIAWSLMFCALQIFGYSFPEKNLRRIVKLYSGSCGALVFAILCSYLIKPTQIHYELPNWFTLHEYKFDAEILIDGLAVAYACLSTFLFMGIMRFSFEYLHREKGYNRFFLLTQLLYSGLMLICFSGNIDVLCIGWEIVGLCSVFLIAFFRQNSRSTENSFRALVFYRICDMGILAATAWLHHVGPSTDFIVIKGINVNTSPAYLLIGSFLIFGSLAKSAQQPMTSWLPRAMEGPTTSSAIFYGALSIHLGPFLLLRCAPFWEHSLALRIILFIIGLTTAITATLTGRVRADAKTSLGFATVAQLGLIYMELAMGLKTLPLIHIISNAALRTWQFLRSSSLIQDFQENPHVTFEINRRYTASFENLLPISLQKRLYIYSLNSFGIETFLQKVVVKPFLNFFSSLSNIEDWVHRQSHKLIYSMINSSSRKTKTSSRPV